METFLQLDILLLLATVAVIAGFVDTLAGGGGLIVIPALMLAQVPPVYAIATNKLQGSFGTLTAATTMIRKNLVSVSESRTPFVMALTGSVFGAVAIQVINTEVVDAVIPVVLIAIALYFLIAKNPGTTDSAPKIEKSAYETRVVTAIGFYDGAFGPGAGSFYTLGGVALAGKNLVAATAQAKVLNFASNLAALCVFVISGKVLWVVGGVMVVGAMVGAYLGSHVVIRGGVRVIRPVIVVVCLAMLANYFWIRYA